MFCMRRLPAIPLPLPHGGNAMNEGFLGTAAPRYADVVLLVEIGMGVALFIGAVLARRRRFRLHAWCQSAIVLLNLVVIVLLMVPSFHVHVNPKIPIKLGKAYYALATAHGALGGVTEIACWLQARTFCHRNCE
jgi:hypothetical protein